MDENYWTIFTYVAGNCQQPGYQYDAIILKKHGLVDEPAMRTSQPKRIVLEVEEEWDEILFQGFNHSPITIHLALNLLSCQM